MVKLFQNDANGKNFENKKDLNNFKFFNFSKWKFYFKNTKFSYIKLLSLSTFYILQRFFRITA